jgi:hypothetical protein
MSIDIYDMFKNYTEKGKKELENLNAAYLHGVFNVLHKSFARAHII